MSRPFRFGLVAAYAASRAMWVATARRAEELGYSTLLMPDRTSVGIPAVIPALAVAAAATTTLRVGSYVFCNGYRSPVLLAREAATLDFLSDGRLELGVGSGVSTDEFEQMGIAAGSIGTRVGQLEEAVKLIKLLCTEETVNFSGKYYTVTDLKGNFKPVQRPHMPVLIAGAGERVLKIAAREADIIAIAARPGDPADASLEQKIAWLKEGAGERFAELELAQSILGMEITDSPVPYATQVGGWPAPKQLFTTEQAVDHLLEQRESYGISYLQVSMQQIENFVPVLTRLAGK